jgi:sigma-54 dependent transcriptional regulator, acetoin dehydrogenase operon transcriptional activator AcoR
MAAEFSNRFLREARDRFLAGDDPADQGLPEQILASWRRSADAGVRPERFEVPFQTDLDADGPLQRAARPVLDHVGEDLPTTGAGLLLTNERAEILDRRVSDRSIHVHLDRIRLAPGFRYGEGDVGTNAIGTALELEGQSIILGGEHFVEALAPIACAAVPIIDPRTGRILGIVDLTSELKDANALMLPLVRRVAREVEQRLLDGLLVGERILREHFLRAKRQGHGPLVCLSRNSMVTNRAAAGILHPSDQALLWESVPREQTGNRRIAELSLANGMSVVAHFEPVRDGAEVVGVLIRLNPSWSPDVIAERPHPLRNRERAKLGWASLTDTERSVAECVAQGLTNAQAAIRLFMSPHTVDSHLRHIYRKLDISSRVQLAGLVVERATSLA